MVESLLFWGRELWMSVKKTLSKIQVLETIFERGVKRYTKLGHFKNKNISEELWIFNLNNRLKIYKRQLNAEIMLESRLDKQIGNYKTYMM